MPLTLADQGFEIHRNILSGEQIAQLRDEADSVAKSHGTVCVRHLRERSAIFNALSVSNTLLSLLPAGMIPVRSILFDKTANENWPVAWHQDLTIAVAKEAPVPGYGPWSHKDGCPHVQPPASLLERMATIRLHLDETPATNGALRVIPKSHKLGRISSKTLESYDKTNAVTCECMPGDALLMSPLILHSSNRSASPTRRRIIHFEYANNEDLDPRLEWYESR